MKTFFALWSLVLHILLVVTVVSKCDIRLIILIATILLEGIVGMFKEELKEELIEELKKGDKNESKF